MASALPSALVEAVRRLGEAEIEYRKAEAALDAAITEDPDGDDASGTYALAALAQDSAASVLDACHRSAQDAAAAWVAAERGSR